MRVHHISIVTLTTACLFAHVHAYADIFRCDGADGKLIFTNIACPDGTRPTTVVRSAETCNSAQCEREQREAPERVKADKDELAVDAEKRHRRDEQAIPVESLDAQEIIKPEPIDLGAAIPSYPIGVPPTVIVLPPSYHRPPHHHPDHHHGGQDHDGQHHDGNHVGEHNQHPHHWRDEVGSTARGGSHPMRDPKSSPEQVGERDAARGQRRLEQKQGKRSAEPQQPKGVRQRES